MSKIDSIIDALYKTKLLFEAHGQYPHTLREVDEALAAAHELQQELATPEQDTYCKHCNGIGCVACDARCLPKPEQEELIQFKDGKWSYVKKPWVRITGDEVAAISLKHGTLTKDDFDFAYAVEAKLKEKNTTNQ